MALVLTGFADEKTKAPVTDEIATAAKDIDVFAGWITRLENPDPVVLSQGGGKGLKLYDEVSRDPHARSVLDTRYLSVAGLEWTVQPAEPAEASGRKSSGVKEQEIADFVTNAFLNSNFSQCCFELLRAILYGVYAAEVLWSVDQNNSVVPAKFITKHPRRFVFTPERELRLLTPSNMITGEPVPPRKFVILSWGDSDNPYGSGLGQSIWWPVWFKKHGVKFWMTFLEKFGQPTILGKYPPGSVKEQQDALMDALEAIQNDTAIKIPETMKVELLEASRSGNVTYETLAEYMDKQISKAVLGQTASSEGTPGKLGGEDSQNDVRRDRVKADADMLAEVLNHSLIRWIVDFNFPAVEAYPTLWFDTEESSDMKAEAEKDEILLKNLGMGRHVPASYLHEKYGLPVVEKGQPSVTPLEPGQPSSNFVEGQQSPGEITDALAARFVDKADSAKMVDPIKDILSQSESLEDFRDRLLDAYAGMDEGELGNLLAQALTLAELFGRADAADQSF